MNERLKKMVEAIENDALRKSNDIAD